MVLVVPAAAVVCIPGGKPVFGKALLIDETSRGIANTLIYLRTKTKTIGWKNVPPPAEVQPVDGDDPANLLLFDQKDCVFLTHVMALRVGQKLKMRNLDPVGHNVNGIGQGGIIAGMGDAIITFEKRAAAPLPVGCNIHPWMSAWVLPYDNGYFAVTDADGNFEIKNLPAGVLLEFNVWHEIAVSPSQRLNLDVPAPENVDLDWTQKRRGRFRITLKPDQTANFGTIEVPVTAFRQ